MVSAVSLRSPQRWIRLRDRTPMCRSVAASQSDSARPRILIIGDMIRTIVVESTVESVLLLGIIVVIRIVLSFALEAEIDGRWPWTQPQPGTEPADHRPPRER